MHRREYEDYDRKGSKHHKPRDREDDRGFRNRDRGPNRERDKERNRDRSPVNDKERHRDDRSETRHKSGSRSKDSSHESSSKQDGRSHEPEDHSVPITRLPAPVPDLTGFRDDLVTEDPEGTVGDDFPAPPPPPRISKVSMTLSKPAAVKPMAIKMKLGGFKVGVVKKSVPKKPEGVASAFNQDSDDDDEEMPTEAKMRMRNIGRETPTSAGPNSFGKTKHGFCDSKKIFEKNLRTAMDK